MAKPKAAKKSAKKAAANNANVYRLSAETAKLAPKEIKGATHRGSIILALKKLGKGTFSSILAEVEKQRKLKTTMEVDKAIRWMCFDGVRKGWLIAQ
jgi:hypothetical protein